MRTQNTSNDKGRENGSNCRRRSAPEQTGLDRSDLYLRYRSDPLALDSRQAGVEETVKVKDLTEDEARKIRQVIQDEGRVEGDLRKEIGQNIRRLIEIGSYRGIRHRRSLPARGQRTHTNARTRKGPRRGAVAGKKQVKK